MRDEIIGEFIVQPQESGLRLDKWLMERLQEEDFEVSRSQVQGWLDAGYVQASHGRPKASQSVEQGAVYQISVPADTPFELVADDVQIDVIYEDEDVIVVDKPRGMVVHPAMGHARNTLLNGLAFRKTALSSLGGAFRPGVVHRIDKETSGLLMLAKSDKAYHSLALQLRLHDVQRHYVAIVHGVLSHDEGTIDAPIGRDPVQRQRMAVVDGGKPAITHFTVLERYRDYSLLRCQLETGRTHQIRVHMAYIEHPLAGDKTYGRRHTLPIDGQALHAQVLGFTHPTTGTWLEFESPLPKDMAHLVNGLSQGLW